MYLVKIFTVLTYLDQQRCYISNVLHLRLLQFYYGICTYKPLKVQEILSIPEPDKMSVCTASCWSTESIESESSYIFPVKCFIWSESVKGLKLKFRRFLTLNFGHTKNRKTIWSNDCLLENLTMISSVRTTSTTTYINF